jgi:hypothetical protein
MSTILSAWMARAYRTAVSQPNPWSGIAKAVACLLAFGALLGAAQPAAAQFAQQGLKLVGSGAVGAAIQGISVALSADGTTAMVGGPQDNSNAGASWEFTQSAGIWTQQGPKSLGAGASGAAEQGYAVALSADGATAIVGGPVGTGAVGAAWVTTLDANVKLPFTGAVGASNIGESVALSADGNTAIVGGPGDNTNTGAVWMFTQTAGAWSQQGTKQLGTGATGAANQGKSVALSADGNTAIVGGPLDNANTGAVWFFSRSNGTWNQQGSKLVGNGAAGAAGQGWSVALSADGNTAIVGGYTDNTNAGAAWVFTRSSNGTWSQQGSKLVGNGTVGAAQQGWSVALSADGTTAIVGGPYDNSEAGAVWVFTRVGNGTWSQQGSKLVGNGGVAPSLQGFSVALSTDGTTAIVGGPLDNADAGAAWVFVSPAHVSGSLTAAPTSGHAPLPVTFRVIGLSLPMTYTINFGDGTVGPLNQGNCFGTQSGFRCSGIASHTYSASGSYTATLSNALGFTLATVTISVNGNVAKPLPVHHPIATTLPLLAARPVTPLPIAPEQASLLH